MLYETLDDRRRQWATCDEYAHALGLDFEMTPEKSLLPWDVEFRKGERVVSIAEVKHRTCERLTYATYKVDRSKVDAMLAEATKRGVKCGMFVEFKDGRFKVPITATWLAQHAKAAIIERKNRKGETPDPAWEWSNKLWMPLTSGVQGVLHVDRDAVPDEGRTEASTGMPDLGVPGRGVLGAVLQESGGEIAPDHRESGEAGGDGSRDRGELLPRVGPSCAFVPCEDIYAQDAGCVFAQGCVNQRFGAQTKRQVTDEVTPAEERKTKKVKKGK